MQKRINSVHMAKIDNSYHKLLNEILKKGYKYEDPNRKGVHRIELSRYTFEHDFKDGFPAVTTKTLFWKGLVGELIWFLRGDTNIKYLVDNDINIWNKDAYNFYKERYKSQVRMGFALIQNMFTFEEFVSTIRSDNKSTLEEFQGIYEYTLGDLGRVYGAQWREWFMGVQPQRRDDPYSFTDVGYSGFKNLYWDQISTLLYELKENPMSTSHIVTAWNPPENELMALPPCHKGFQVMCYPLSLKERMKLPKAKGLGLHTLLDEVGVPKYGFDLVWEQRSVDTFLGLPFNIASYALLMQIIAKITGYIPGKLYGDLRNVHIYDNHLEAVKKQLSRKTTFVNSRCDFKFADESLFKSKNEINYDELFKSFEINQFILDDYKSQGYIKADMVARDV